MRILGIETSCDETAASVLERVGDRIHVRSHVVHSQVATHRKTHGVVPEVAAREHVQKLPGVIDLALSRASTTLRSLDLIAVTEGPGLITSLLVGTETAKSLAFLSGVPVVGVNHLEGHLLSGLMNRPLRFPILGLIVSGGHTELVLVRSIGTYDHIGRTRDDAAGEAFDKVAVLLNLGYPGGPIVSALAARGNRRAIPFPRPMIDSPDYDFSFSGLKTAVRYHVADRVPTGRALADLAASFEEAVVDVVVTKAVRAARHYRVRGVALGGGVSANKRLRSVLRRRIRSEIGPIDVFQPPMRFTGDNATMIALVTALRYAKPPQSQWRSLTANPSLALTDDGEGVRVPRR